MEMTNLEKNIYSDQRWFSKNQLSALGFDDEWLNSMKENGGYLRYVPESDYWVLEAEDESYICSPDHDPINNNIIEDLRKLYNKGSITVDQVINLGTFWNVPGSTMRYYNFSKKELKDIFNIKLSKNFQTNHEELAKDGYQITLQLDMEDMVLQVWKVQHTSGRYSEHYDINIHYLKIV